MGYGLAALLCLCALWSAAQVSILRPSGASATSDFEVNAAPPPRKTPELWRYLPVLQ